MRVESLDHSGRYSLNAFSCSLDTPATSCAPSSNPLPKATPNVATPASLVVPIPTSLPLGSVISLIPCFSVLKLVRIISKGKDTKLPTGSLLNV